MMRALVFLAVTAAAIPAAANWYPISVPGANATLCANGAAAAIYGDNQPGAIYCWATNGQAPVASGYFAQRDDSTGQLVVALRGKQPLGAALIGIPEARAKLLTDRMPLPDLAQGKKDFDEHLRLVEESKRQAAGAAIDESMKKQCEALAAGRATGTAADAPRLKENCIRWREAQLQQKADALGGLTRDNCAAKIKAAGAERRGAVQSVCAELAKRGEPTDVPTTKKRCEEATKNGDKAAASLCAAAAAAEKRADRRHLDLASGDKLGHILNPRFDDAATRNLLGRHLTDPANAAKRDALLKQCADPKKPEQCNQAVAKAALAAKVADRLDARYKGDPKGAAERRLLASYLDRASEADRKRFVDVMETCAGEQPDNPAACQKHETDRLRQLIAARSPAMKQVCKDVKATETELFAACNKIYGVVTQPKSPTGTLATADVPLSPQKKIAAASADPVGNFFKGVGNAISDFFNGIASIFRGPSQPTAARDRLPER